MEYENAFDELSYWSSGTARNIEVDFLLQNGAELTAIEVKTTKKVKTEDLKGLKAISELKRVKRKIFVYLGTTKMEQEGIEIMPFSLFQKTFLTV